MKNILVCTIVFIPSVVCGQVAARVAGLENNKEYMELLQNDKKLHAVEDSVLKVITETRRLFAADNGNSDKREKYRTDIIRLEKELFEVRDSVGIVSSKINRIEQDFILNNMGKTAVVVTETPDAGSKDQKKNLVYNHYFKENLGKQDYETLLRAQQKEALVSRIIDKYMQNYDTLAALANAYSVESDKNIALDTYAKYKTLDAVNKRMEDSLAAAWGYVYDNKTYSYNLLLDKMNRSDLLSGFENQLQDIRQQVASAADVVASSVLFAYPLQKRMVLAYEKSMADILGNKAAADSLAKVISSVSRLSYAQPKVELEERVFIDYIDMEITSPSKYNSRNPIPENEVYPKGTVYKVQVGNFIRAQPVSVFRGAYPLSYDVLEDGRHRYYVGAFREQAQAEEAVAKLKRAGFRRPEIVVWRDGVYENLAPQDSPSSSSATPAQMYKVEILGEGENMSEDTKNVIDTSAEGKELSRVATPEGKFIYTVGSFDDRESAEHLVERLGAVDGISAKVIVIESTPSK